MTRFKSLSWLAAGLVALLGFANAAPPAAGADEAAIRAQSLSWAKAYNGGDAKGVAALYADDALLLPPGAPGVRGRASILDSSAGRSRRERPGLDSGLLYQGYRCFKSGRHRLQHQSQNRSRSLGQYGLGVGNLYGSHQ